MVQRHLAVVPDHPFRYLPYARVSALMGRGGDDFYSPEIQLGEMRDYIDRRGGIEVPSPTGQPLADIDVSGTTFARAQLDIAVQVAMGGGCDGIIVMSTDRFGRNLLDGLILANELRKRGVRVIAIEEGIDETDEGQERLADELLRAQKFSRRIGRNWSRVAQRRAVQGKPHGGPTPTGYRRSLIREDGRRGGPLEPHPDTAAATADLFRRHASGARIAPLILWYRAVTGITLTHMGLKSLLSNPIYLGQIRLKGQIYPGQHPSLIDQTTFDQCQARLRLDSTTPARILQTAWSLSGLTRCQVCGAPLFYAKVTRSYGVYHTVRHIQPHLTNRSCPAWGQPPLKGVIGRVRVEQLEEEVLAWIADYAQKLRGDSGAIAEHRARRATAQATLNRLHRELSASQTELTELTLLLTRKVIGDDAYRLTSAQLSTTQDELLVAIDGAKVILATGEPTQTLNLAEELLALWKGMLVDEKNQLLRLILREIHIAPARRHGDTLDGRVFPIPI